MHTHVHARPRVYYQMMKAMTSHHVYEDPCVRAIFNHRQIDWFLQPHVLWRNNVKNSISG